MILPIERSILSLLPIGTYRAPKALYALHKGPQELQP